MKAGGAARLWDVMHTAPARLCLKLALAAYWLTLAITTHWPKLDIHVNETQSMGDVNLDKPVHAMAFAGLALLAMGVALTLKKSTVLAYRRVMAAAVIIAGYAYLDELTQQWFERTTSSGDLLSNLTGIALAAWGMLLVVRIAARQTQQFSIARVMARLVMMMFLPVGLLMAMVPSLALQATWPAWFAAMFTQAWGPRFAVMMGTGAIATVVTMLAFPAPADVPTRLTKWGRIAGLVALMLVTGCVLLWVASKYNPAVMQLDPLAWALGSLLASLAVAGFYVAQPAAGSRPDFCATDDVAQDPRPAEDEITAEKTETSASPAKPAGFVGHAKTVSILTFVSRITGLVREAVIAGVFGMSPIAAAFIFAFQIPNLFRRLFGEGALSAAVIPVYARTLEEDPVAARRFVSLCMTLLAITLGLIMLLGEFALALAITFGSWQPETQLALKLTMLMLPYMPLVCMVALIGAVLQVRGRFASTAAVPIVLNAVVVAGTLAGWFLLMKNPGQDVGDIAQSDGLRVIYLTSLSVIIAGILQLSWQLWELSRVEKLTRVFTGTRQAMQSLKAIFLPMVVGLAAFQINTFLDAAMAMGLSAKAGADAFTFMGYTIAYPMQESAVAALGWSQRLYEFPLGIFGIAIATAIFPALSRAAAAAKSRGFDDFTTICHHGLRLSAYIGLPASAGLLIVALPLSRLAYERGQFDSSDAARVAWLLVGYAPAIWAYSMNHVLTRAFYALGDSRTPLRVSLMMVVLNLLLNVTLVWPLGAIGFALATAICAIVQCVILTLTLERYQQQPLGATVWLSLGRSLVLTLAMSAVLVPLMLWLDPASLSRTHNAIALAGLVVTGGAVYAALSFVTRCEEVRWLLGRRAK